MSSTAEKTVMIFVTTVDKILLHRRLNTWFGNNQFSAPGGLVDKDETAEEAAVRELLEETAIQTDISSFDLLDRETTKGNGRVFDNFYFHTNNWSGKLINLEPDRHTDLGWYELSNLPEPLMPKVKELIIKLSI